VLPGVSYLVAGIKTILRISGLPPKARIMPPFVMSFMLTSGVALLGSLFFLFFWVMGRSVWLNEGGDLSDFPNDHYLLIAGGCVALGLIAIAMTVTAFKIEDPPRA